MFDTFSPVVRLTLKYWINLFHNCYLSLLKLWIKLWIWWLWYAAPSTDIIWPQQNSDWAFVKKYFSPTTEDSIKNSIKFHYQHHQQKMKLNQNNSWYLTMGKSWVMATVSIKNVCCDVSFFESMNYKNHFRLSHKIQSFAWSWYKNA